MTRDDMDKKLDEALEDLAFDGWTDYAAAIRQLRIHTRAAEQEIASLRARLDAAEQENKRLRSRSKPSLPSRGQREAI